LVYAATIWGIKLAGATLFNFVDYGAMPIITLALAMYMAKEPPKRSFLVGALISLVGIVALNVYGGKVSFELNLGVACALVSATGTSLCSAYQKRQIDEGLNADLVLMFRFPIPAAVLLVFCAVQTPSVELEDIWALLVVSFIGVFLPLLLLCFGFASQSLSQFSAYLFLIPVLTFVFGAALNPATFSMVTNSSIVFGMVLVLLGFLVAEGWFAALRRGLAGLGEGAQK